MSSTPDEPARAEAEAACDAAFVQAGALHVPRPLSSRARGIDGRTERIAFIRGLMVAGQWVTGKTFHELADAWGVEGVTVRSYSAEASRQVRESLGEPDEIRTHLLCTLEHAAKMARDEGGARGAQALTGIVKEFASLAGVAEPQRIQVDGLAGLLAVALAAPSSDDATDDT